MSKKKKNNKELNLSNQPMMNEKFVRLFLDSPPSESIHWVVDMLVLCIKNKWGDDLTPIDLFLITKYISDAIPITVTDSIMDRGQDVFLQEGWDEFESMSEEEVYESTGTLLELPIKV